MRKLIIDIDILLDDLMEYMKDRSDCDAGTPNEELKFADEIGFIQNRIRGLQQKDWDKTIANLKTKFNGSSDYMSGVNDGMYAIKYELGYSERRATDE